jgi:hypothetical protein
MRFAKRLLCVLPLLAVTACADDDGITNLGPPPPAALVRFINVNVDTGVVSLRFTDRTENLPTLMGVNFRSTSGFYQRVGSGNRETIVFLASSDINLAPTRMVDTNLNLVENQRYTMVYAGRTRAGTPAGEAARLLVLEDPPASALPNPDTAQIALQALHAAIGVGNVDVYIVPVASATATIPTDFLTNNVGVLRNIGYLQRAQNYVTVPRRATGFYSFVVTAANSQSPIFAVAPNQPGTAGTASAGPQPGVRIGRSVMTAVIAPGALDLSRSSVRSGTPPVCTNCAPTVFLMPDRVLNQ